MRFLRAWFLRLGELVFRQHRDLELAAEMENHLEMHVADGMRSGLSAEEARRRAVLALGGIDQTKETYRDRRGFPALEAIVRNVSFGLRMLRKNRGFTTVVLLMLALGIGANTAIFTVAYRTLLGPLPYPQPDRLVSVWSVLQGRRTLVSAGDFTDWKRRSSVFEDLNAWGTDNFNIATQDRPEFFNGMRATVGYYKMLGNPLYLGRSFLPEEGEGGKEHVVLLTNQLWRHLGADHKIIGKNIQINGEPYTVVGVMAPGTADRWDWKLIVPLIFRPEQLGNHDFRGWAVTGRLKPSITINQARAELSAIAANEAEDYPKSDQGVGTLLVPFKKGLLPRDRQLTLWALLGAVGFVLVIACLNIANLLLAKGITRHREIAVRCSLGAKPAAIFGQFLTETLVLAILGGLVGVAVGYAMLRGIVTVMPSDALPAEAELQLNLPILVSMLAATTMAGLLFGFAPAWYASRIDPVDLLRHGEALGAGPGRDRLRQLLVIAEFAVVLPLLAGAGLALHSFWNLTHVDAGIRTDHVLGFYLDPVRLPQGPLQINSYYRRILASIEAVPGVSHASAMSYLPLDSMHAEMRFAMAGKPDYANTSLRPNADFETVTPDYFQTFGIEVVRGRAFTDADNESSLRVAMVNEAFAERFLKGVDPLEQRLVVEQLTGEPKNGPSLEWQVVGVFHTVKSRGAREDNPEIDVPFWQMAFPVSGIGVRTVQDPASMLQSISKAVSAVDSQAALALTRTMVQVHDDNLANDRFTAILIASFSFVGFLLATVGIYGVTAFSVAQRSHEIAVRMALGESRNRIVVSVMQEGLALAGVGLGVGLIIAYLVGNLMRSLVFGVGAIDLSTLNVASFAFLMAALLACYKPVRAATRVDPMVILRHE